MNELILITGGAGFIGSHLADELLENGYRVRILDNLSLQVHGPERKKPAYLNPEIEFIKADVRDQTSVLRALKGVSAVYHFAAAVGVGQSMYQIQNYTSVNNMGTSVLLECILQCEIQRLIVASSMSIYGEGMYQDTRGNLIDTAERSLDQLKNGKWELFDKDGAILHPVSTPEQKKPALTSIYALSKYDQERMCLMVGRAYNIPAVALRFFNVYGTRQALSNPYTGVLAIFASRFLNGKGPIIYEDGLQRRDFVSVHDVANACRLAFESPKAIDSVINIGSGNAYTISQIAQNMASAMNVKNYSPVFSGKYRVGDIRHCYADIRNAEIVLGFVPKVSLEDGIKELSEWLEDQDARDYLDSAHAELIERGLTV